MSCCGSDKCRPSRLWEKSGGKPAFPTARLLDLRDCFHIESRSSSDHNLKSDQLEVRKAGLPPLFFRKRTQRGGNLIEPFMLIGTVQQIWRYPVKSMAGEQLSECTVRELGLPGDRGWAVRDEEKSEIKTGTRIPLLMRCASQYREQPSDDSIPHVKIIFPDGSSVSSDDAEVNIRLSAVLGKQVRLWPRQPASNKDHYRRPGIAARVIAPLTNVPGFRALLPAITKLPSIDATL